MLAQEHLKAIGDSVAVPTAVLAWLHAISIPDAAALAACIYTVLRIGELLYGWLKKWRRRHG